MSWWVCGVTKPSGETDGAGGQLSKHRTHFSVTTSRRLGKHAGVSVIDALINKLIALFIIRISLRCLCSVHINMISAFILSGEQQRWGAPSNRLPSIFTAIGPVII